MQMNGKERVGKSKSIAVEMTLKTKKAEPSSNGLSSKKNRTNLLKSISTNKTDRCAHKFNGYWKSLDVFGERVEFTFKGKRSY